jgi:hypothetical protein
MQIGELVAVGVIAGDDECPFKHRDAEVKPRDNVFPPAGGKELNNAATLAKKMGDEKHFSDLMPITVDGKEEQTQYSAHHLVPGNETWPKTALKKWVDKKFSHIKENIGYDVNKGANGASLPGWTGYKYGTSYGVFGKPWGSYKFQQDYAFKAMRAVGDQRQFHDRHATYSKFVLKALNKISEKLDARVRAKKPPGCGHNKCMGAADDKKPFNPPYELLVRIDDVALRLEGFLVCSHKRWQAPLFTSRWALAYAKGASGVEAGKALSDLGKKL